MGIKVFQIEVPNKSDLIFIPGETIEGILHVETEKENKTEGISVAIVGKGRVLWSEGANLNYIRDQEYVNEKIDLYGTGSTAVVLPAGVHQFPFKFTLPLGLPSSFKDVYGSISYEMKAEMQRSWLINHKVTVPFTVNGTLDLNNEQGASQPIEVNKSKNVGILSHKGNSVGFVLKMSRTGYVPGEFLQFNAEFSNQSSRKVKGVTASLIQWTHYHTKSRSKSMSQTVCQNQGPAVESGGNEIWSGNVFQIPELPPSRLGQLEIDIMDIQYILKIEMHLSGPSINLKKEIPVIIGTIPLENIGGEENAGN